MWLRLNDETVKKYVPSMNGYTEAWCLSFNQHLGRSLLVPADVSKRWQSADSVQRQERLLLSLFWGKCQRNVKGQLLWLPVLMHGTVSRMKAFTNTWYRGFMHGFIHFEGSETFNCKYLTKFGAVSF